MKPQRRHFLAACAAAVAAPALANKHAPPLVEVWKSPTCGCCKDWIKHLEANGFAVRVSDTGNTQARGQLGMPAQLGSCPRKGDQGVRPPLPC